MEDSSSNKELFQDHYKRYYRDKPNKRPYTQDQLRQIAIDILNAKTAPKKSRRDYHLLTTYDVVTMNDENLVIKKVKNEGDPLIYIVPEEDIYERLRIIHINCDHGSRDKMISIINSNSSIPRPCVEMFLKSCETCQMKKNKGTAKIVVRPMASKNFMTRGQVDLIDYQSIADGDFKYLLNYQDHATKYVCLRPLNSKDAVVVAEELLKIFLQFGAPAVLQSDNGRAFANKIVDELKVMWPQLCIVHGRPRHPQSQANRDVENMLRSWMVDRKSQKWSLGCHYVQWQKNSMLHRAIGSCPYRAAFGKDPKLGLESSNLPNNVTATITTEEELEKAAKGFQIHTSTENENSVEEEVEYLNETFCTENESSDNHIEMQTMPTDDIMMLEDNVENNQACPNNLEKFLSISINTYDVCAVCENSITEQNCIKCELCEINVHVSCSNGRQKCNFCASEKTIQSHQDKCYEGQKCQATSMLAATKNDDRGPEDLPNLVTAATDIKNNVYQPYLSTKDNMESTYLSENSRVFKTDQDLFETNTDPLGHNHTDERIVRVLNDLVKIQREDRTDDRMGNKKFLLSLLPFMEKFPDDVNLEVRLQLMSILQTYSSGESFMKS